MRAGLAQYGAGVQREAEEGAGLHRLQGDDAAEIGDLLAFGLKIQHLATGHAVLAGSLCQLGDERTPDRGIGMRRLVAQYLESESQEGVAGEDRGRLVEGLVHGRPPAAQIVVVHRRQVVMDERIAMHAFDRRAGLQGADLSDIEKAGALGHEEGPDPFARRQERITHRFDEAGRAGALGREEAFEMIRDRPGKVGEMLFEMLLRG